MFDLYLLTLNIASGQEKGDLPGLLAAPAPKRCDRSRAGDLLLAQFTLAGGSPLAEEQVEKLLQNTAGAYFSARGSATAGLRAAIEDLNNLLLTNNLQKVRQGGPRTGSLNLAEQSLSCSSRPNPGDPVERRRGTVFRRRLP